MTNAVMRSTYPDLAHAWHLATFGDSPDWGTIRDYCDGLLSNPTVALDELRAAPEASGSEFFDVFLAALAETLADKLGIARPAWASHVPGLASQWHVPVTPMMLARQRASTPVPFLARNIVVDADSLWHIREHGI